MPANMDKQQDETPRSPEEKKIITENIEMVTSVAKVEGDTEASGDSDQPRLSYNTGHGDFCFGRQFTEDCGPSLNPKYQYVENNVRFVGRNGFQRSGPFPFFKLPLEIRHRIFGLLCGPCFKNTDLITINFENSNPIDVTKPGWWNKSLEEYRLSAGKDWGWDGHAVILSTEHEKKAREKLAKDQKSFILRKTPHPDRAGRYSMSIDPLMANGFGKLEFRKDWSMIELIRDLSNVSIQFRKEFGDVFWTRTKITMRSPNMRNNLFPEFLSERPAVCGGIRHLDFGLNLTEYLNDSKGQQQFLRFCHALSTLPNLEVFTLKLWMDKSDLPKLEPGSGTRKCLDAFRSLPVMKGFNLSIIIYGDGGDRVRQVELKDKWTPKIMEIMQPNTLRTSKTLTELEQYLRSRPCHRNDAGDTTKSDQDLKGTTSFKQ